MPKNEHSADAAALGFLYQGQFALLLLWQEEDDDAVVWVETLDDVVLKAGGDTILNQLKHSLQERPRPLTVASVQLWKTLRAWIDVLGQVDVARTRLHLVTVAEIASESPLRSLLDDDACRDELRQALDNEASRVVNERDEARRLGKATLPHAERAAGCEAYLSLSEFDRSNLIARARIRPGQPTIAQIEVRLAAALRDELPRIRSEVARQLVEWWNGQVLDLLSGRRNTGITRFELLKRKTEIVVGLELDELTSAYAVATRPTSDVPDTMIERQVRLVGGRDVDLQRAVREEWRARMERSRWSTENPARLEIIRAYDERLVEEWFDRHSEMCLDCEGATEDIVADGGYGLLQWSHFDAPKALEPIAPRIVSPYYVRGSYQILSVTGLVGWHAAYREMLGFGE